MDTFKILLFEFAYAAVKLLIILFIFGFTVATIDKWFIQPFKRARRRKKGESQSEENKKASTVP